MRNPFARTAQPDAELCHLRQQVATLQGELHQAHATIATLRSDNAQLRNCARSATRRSATMSFTTANTPARADQEASTSE